MESVGKPVFAAFTCLCQADACGISFRWLRRNWGFPAFPRAVEKGGLLRVRFPRSAFPVFQAFSPAISQTLSHQGFLVLFWMPWGLSYKRLIGLGQVIPVSC